MFILYSEIILLFRGRGKEGGRRRDTSDLKIQEGW